MYQNKQLKRNYISIEVVSKKSMEKTWKKRKIYIQNSNIGIPMNQSIKKQYTTFFVSN
jgi:hypothetical protein